MDTRVVIVLIMVLSFVFGILAWQFGIFCMRRHIDFLGLEMRARSRGSAGVDAEEEAV
jgi:hypothetical protein